MFQSLRAFDDVNPSLTHTASCCASQRFRFFAELALRSFAFVS